MEHEVEAAPVVRNALLVPASIIIGGFIIAIGVYIVRTNHPSTASLSSPSAVAPVNSETDHIIGSPTAPVVLIEYSDLDCQYCTQFSTTMGELMNEYAAGGKVAWVFRHFPIASSHPNAPKHAVAAECAAKLAGGNAFWKFMDALHDATPTGAQFDPKNYPALLPPLGIEANAFNACLTDKDIAAKVSANFENALAAGADGAPYSILLVNGKDPAPISGSIPYAAMKKILDEAIGKASAN